MTGGRLRTPPGRRHILSSQSSSGASQQCNTTITVPCQHRQLRGSAHLSVFVEAAHRKDSDKYVYELTQREEQEEDSSLGDFFREGEGILDDDASSTRWQTIEDKNFVLAWAVGIRQAIARLARLKLWACRRVCTDSYVRVSCT